MAEELEWQTRRERINKKLKALSLACKIVKHSEKLNPNKLVHHAVKEYPIAKGPADYALFVNGKLLGIIETKKVTVGPKNFLEQAKRYSKSAFNNVGNWDGYRVTFLYSSNGELVWYLDVRNPKNISHQIANFSTSVALEEFFTDDITAGYELLQTDPTGIQGLRPYQHDAEEALENALFKHKRALLLGMATARHIAAYNQICIHPRCEQRGIQI